MRKTAIILFALLMGAVVGNAKVRLPQVFQSGMVLQRGTSVPVWGQADAGETVVVKLNKKTVTTVADASGKWRVDLPAMKAGGPYVLEVRGERLEVRGEKPDAILLTDVWLGDVWLCTGQSNMETTLERVSPQYPDELNDSNAMVRLFHVQYQTNPHQPSADLRPTSWKKLNRENAWRFSSIGYFLGKQLQREKGVAQGIIESAWGGTPIEAWIAADTLKKHFHMYYKQMQLYQNDEYVAAQQRAAGQAEQQWQKILNANDPGLGKYTELNYDDSGWKEVNQYNLSSKREWIGSLWLRQHIHIDAQHAGKKAQLLLGTLYDCDYTYINGKLVGNTGYQYPPRRYQVPEGLLREGDNVITVRFINKSGMPHFIKEKPYKFVFGKGDEQPIGEKWLLCEGAEMPRAIGMGVSLQNQPSTLFNGMIHPLAPFAVAGVVWYQGESNTGMHQAVEYAPMLRLLMANWRQAFERPQMPFVIVQLANYMAFVERPQDTGWSRVREAQRIVAAEDPYSELALTIDLGETVDIHPLRKKEVAERIALNFERLVYGKKVQLAPQVLSSEIKDGKVILTLDQALMPGSLKFFELADEKGTFRNVEATASGNQIIITSPIEKPTAVRYAWKDNPLGVNVYGVQNHLPLSPFECKQP
ncbi:sialate O-acetylesterase [Prevotella sp. E2-28]|uniref:sialate O-acetylesterase n=1 Tax=Prevotella sp. E2-28 TaxID=2913620 RepID=UPI001EDB246B|nr:sialate O-acetylesterase [Prevotella sp. E2-28]UKK53859.1 sialate O-acetylesterase [Prevotella sp. E2-28]